MTDEPDVLSRLVDYHDHIAPPTVPVTDDVRRGRRRVRRNRGIVTGTVALGVAGVVLTASLITGGDRDTRPAPTPSPTEKHTAIDPILSSGSPEVLAAQQVGPYRLEIAGEIVPGRWWLEDSRRDVWVAEHFDEVGYSSTSLWWGKGRTTHEVLGQPSGVAISQDARWIAWTRWDSESYQPDPSSPRVMEVVDTATGEVRWSRNANADTPESGPMTVTNDGVVVYGHCLELTFDPLGWPRCDAEKTRIDVWAPRSDTTRTVSAELTHVQVTGSHNGFLISDARPGYPPSDRPRYVRVTGRGAVQVVAVLPGNTVAVTADERFALLATECADGPLVCGWSVLPLDGGERRPLPSLAKLVTIANGYDWPVDPYVVERADLLVVRDLGDDNDYPAVARCSLAQARCVRIEE